MPLASDSDRTPSCSKGTNSELVVCRRFPCWGTQPFCLRKQAFTPRKQMSDTPLVSTVGPCRTLAPRIALRSRPSLTSPKNRSDHASPDADPLHPMRCVRAEAIAYRYLNVLPAPTVCVCSVRVGCLVLCAYNVLHQFLLPFPTDDPTNLIWWVGISAVSSEVQDAH